MNAPDCPSHHSPMLLVEGDNLFRCMEPGCTWTAMPTDEAQSQAQLATDKTWPEVLSRNVIYQGDVELVCRPADVNQPAAVYLRLVDQEVMIDVSRCFVDLSTNAQQNCTDDGQVTSTRMYTELKLRFQDVRYFS